MLANGLRHSPLEHLYGRQILNTMNSGKEMKESKIGIDHVPGFLERTPIVMARATSETTQRITITVPTFLPRDHLLPKEMRKRKC